MQFNFRGRIHENNLTKYMVETYAKNSANPFIVKREDRLVKSAPLLQNNYGLALDCSLTSITEVVKRELNDVRSAHAIYSFVEKIAEKHFYEGNKFGTIPIFIKSILNKTLKHFGAARTCSKSAYLKDVGFNWNSITKQIKKNNLVILNMWNDGRNYYKDHTVTVVGYRVYRVENTLVKLLVVHDNWHDEISFVDYRAMNRIASINYIY